MGRMVRERVWCDTGFSGVDWFPMAILGGRAGGASSVSTLGGRAGVCTGDSEGAGVVSRWAITLRSTRRVSLGSVGVLCSGVEFGGGRGLGSKMSWMRVRDSNRLVCSVPSTSFMAHVRNCRAWNMRSSGVTVG